MASKREGRLSRFTIFPLIFMSTMLVNGRIAASYPNPITLADTGFENERTRSSQFLHELCNIDGQVIDLEKDGKDIPILKLDSSRYAPERHLLSKLKNKKSQRVILLDVGDFVVKSNGEGGQVMAVDVAAPRTPAGNGVGGILRNSG